MSKHNPLMEPVFFTPPASKRLYKGGGSSSAYYENQDKLLGVQADIASNMYDQYAGYAPGYLANSANMVNDANSGALGARMRSQASADAGNAAAMERAATTRQLQSMGVNPNDQRFAGGLRRTEVNNAAQRASTINNASWQAEDQKWNRNANAYGQIAGMGTGAMQGMSSAASGYGNAANAQTANANANAAGMGQFGAAVGASLFKADGGYIDEPHYAIGGPVNANPMPKLGNWRDQATGGGFKGPSASDQFMSFAAPLAATAGLKAGAGALSKAAKAGYDKLFPSTPGGTNTLADFTNSSMYDAGFNAANGAAADAATKVGTEATTDAATGAVGSSIPGLGQTVGFGTNLAQGDYIGAGLNLIPGGNYLDMGKDALQAVFGFAEGGPVARQNFQPGGAVQGPGGPTEDAIPAWLSNGEHVQNETSTQLAGVDVLDAINQIGLQVRQGKLSPDAAVQLIGQIMKSRGEELSGGEPAPEEAPQRGLRTAKNAKKAPAEKKFKSTKPAKMDLKESK